METIRLFISSPGDVAPEREICRRVLLRLNREFSGRAQLEGYFWEYEPMEITQDLRDAWLTLQNALFSLLNESDRGEEGEKLFQMMVTQLGTWSSESGSSGIDWGARVVDLWTRRGFSGVMISAYEDAEQALQKADEAMADVRDSAEREKMGRELTETWGFLETHRGNPAEASKRYRSLLDGFEPSAADPASLLAYCLLSSSLTDTLTAEGKLAEAITNAEVTLAWAQRLAGIDATNVSNRQVECEAFRRLALLHGQKQDWQPAGDFNRQAYECAVALLELDRSAHPLAAVLNYAVAQSSVLQFAGNLPRALAVMESAHSHAEALTGQIDAQHDNKYARQWKNQLATYYEQLAICYRYQTPKRIDEAQAACQTAIDLLEGAEGYEAARDNLIIHKQNMETER